MNRVLVLFMTVLLLVAATHGKPAQLVDLPPMPATRTGFRNAIADGLRRLPHVYSTGATRIGLIADAELLIADRFFDKVATFLTPNMTRYVENMTISGASQEHYSYGAFKLADFRLGNVSIGVEAPNKVILMVGGIYLSVPRVAFTVKEKIAFVPVSCSGHFWGSLGLSSVAMTVTVSVNTAGKIVTAPVRTDVYLANLTVHHTMGSTLCKVASSILSVFFGSLDSKIAAEVRAQVPRRLEAEIPPVLNNELARIPFVFAGQPKVLDDAVAVAVNLMESQREKHTFRSVEAEGEADEGYGLAHAIEALGELRHSLTVVDGELPASPADVQGFPTKRDLILFMRSSCLDAFLIEMQRKGDFNHNFTMAKVTTKSLQQLIPRASYVCPNCPLTSNITFVDAPTSELAFRKVGIHAASVDIVIGAQPEKSPRQMELFTIRANLTVDIVNLTVTNPNVSSTAKELVPLAVRPMNQNGSSTVHFKLTLGSCTGFLKSSRVGPVQRLVVSRLLGALLKEGLVPAFNHRFNGVALSPQLSQVEAFINPRSVDVGFDINLGS